MSHCHAFKNVYWDKKRHQNLTGAAAVVVVVPPPPHPSDKFLMGELKLQEQETVNQLIREQNDLGLQTFHMKAFQQFLLQVPHGRNKKTISAQNVRRTISVIERLVAGQGVHYIHWPEDFSFYKGNELTLNSDLESIQQEASAINQRGGRWRDLGNGWALNHPLQKMIDYRNFLNTHRIMVEYYRK